MAKEIIKADQLKAACDPVTIKQVEGQRWLEIFADYYDNFNKAVEEEHTAFGQDKFNSLLEHVTGNSKKIKRDDTNALKEKY